MTEGARDFLKQAYWRKRIHQIKQEFHAATVADDLSLPEQTKADGPELKPNEFSIAGS